MPELNSGLIYDNGRRGRVDILIYPDDMQPVAVEAAVEKTSDIDGDAIHRLGAKETKTNRVIMTAVALEIPVLIRNTREMLGNPMAIREWLIGGGELEYAVYSAVPGEQGKTKAKPYDIRYPDGKPNSGRIRGTARDLAAMIELAATPDKK